MLEEGSIHLTGIKLLAPHLTAENHRDGAGVRPLEEQAGDRGDRRPASPAAGRADVGRADPGVRGRAPAAADGVADPPRRSRGRRRWLRRCRSSHRRRRAAHRSDAAVSAALQAPAHDQRRDAREAAPREGHARARRSRRETTTPSSTARSPSCSTSSPARSSPRPTSRGRAGPGTREREGPPRRSGASSGSETRVAASTPRRTATGARRRVASRNTTSTRGRSETMPTRPTRSSCAVNDTTTTKAGSTSASGGGADDGEVRERPAPYGARSFSAELVPEQIASRAAGPGCGDERA